MQTTVAPIVVEPVYHNIVQTPPPSVSNEDWTSFDNFTTRVFQSEFCHNNHLDVNVRLPSTKAGYLKVKQQINFTNDLKYHEQLRLWFPMSFRNGSFVYAHILDQKVKIHYDHGYVKVSDYLLNLYGSVDFLKNYSQKDARIGVSHTTRKVHTNFRLKYDQDSVVTLYHKTHLRFKEWKFGFQGVVDLTKKSLLKKDLVLGYEVADLSVYLKGKQTWERKTHDFNRWREFFSEVSLTALYRRNLKELYGVEVAADPLANAVKTVTGLVQYQHNLTSRIKAKLNQRMLFTFVLEKKINNQLTASLGAELPLQPKTLNKERRQTKVGLKLSFNL